MVLDEDQGQAGATAVVRQPLQGQQRQGEVPVVALVLAKQDLAKVTQPTKKVKKTEASKGLKRGLQPLSKMARLSISSLSRQVTQNWMKRLEKILKKRKRM